MTYNKIITGKFVARPNRFIAQVEIEGRLERVHVKNTGRCRELLVPGARLILEDCSQNKNRKTRYSIIAVYKGDRLINMDSQVPNQVVHEAISEGRIARLGQVENLRREFSFLSSRFDIYFEKNGQASLLEVKGVTLEEEGRALFPDAPTARGRKHLLELVEALDLGYKSYVLFLIQMEEVHSFSPNQAMDPDFYQALLAGQEAGLEILAYNCRVTEDSIDLLEEIPVEL